MTTRQIKYVPEDVGAAMREAYRMLYSTDEEDFMKFFNTTDAILNKRPDQTFKHLTHLKKDDIGKYIVIDGKLSGVLTDFTADREFVHSYTILVVLDGKVHAIKPGAIVLVEEASKTP